MKSYIYPTYLAETQQHLIRGEGQMELRTPLAFQVVVVHVDVCGVDDGWRHNYGDGDLARWTLKSPP